MTERWICVACSRSSKRGGLCVRLSRIPVIWTIAVFGVASNADAVYDPSSTMTPGPPDEEQGNDAVQGAADAELTQRLAQAEIVISGEVSATARFAAQRPGFLSEHDADWWQATIEIETVEKGKVATKTIAVLFANSDDIAWYRSPKIKKGERGVWLLQNRDTLGKPVPGLAVVRPLDRQPITELARIRTLLKNANKK
jgi:hypothetical protein